MRTSALRPIIYCVIVTLLSAATLAAAETDTRLVEAAQRGDETAVAELLQPGVDADAAASDGATALHWAAHLDKLKMARRLVRAGAKANVANRYGVTPLMLACTNGNAAMLELLLKAGADPNIIIRGAGETPLMIAARTGKTPAIRTLLAHGAKPNSVENARGQTALMWAAADGHVGAVQTLIKSEADVNVRSKGGFTAFLFAVRQGKIGVVQALLKAGADVNQALPGKQGRRDAAPAETTGTSALGLAIGNAHYELAMILLDSGAHPNGVRKDRTPLHSITWVRKSGFGSAAPAPRGSGRMNSLEFVRKLVQHGADVNARMTSRSGNVRTDLNMRGATPFLLAARAGDAELMRLLVKLGADPLIPNKDNTTPLMVAAGIGVHAPTEDGGTESEVFEAVKAALELGNDVNAVDDRGNTAMHGAAYKYAASVVPLLVESGAKIEVWNKKNKSGWTPLRIATGVQRGLNFRSSAETAAAIRKVMIAAGVSTVLESEKNARGSTK